MLCAQIDICQVILEEEILKFCQCIFGDLSLSWKRAWPFTCKTWILITVRCFDYMKLAKWFCRRRFYNFAKLEPPIPKVVLRQVWFQLVWWFRRNRFSCLLRRGPVLTGRPACVDSNHSPRFLYQSEVLTSHFSVNHLENALWQVDKSDPVCVMIILLIKANVCLSLLGMRLQKPRARVTAGVVP